MVLRLLNLGADPQYYAWAGHITDEGRWTQQARALALFGAPDVEYWLAMVHLVVAPLYQAVTWVSFELFGVGFVSARLVSALSGCALLLLVWLFLRRHVSYGGAVLGVALVAFQRDLIFLSRVAIPEMTFTVFVFLAWALLVTGPRTASRALAAGVVTAVALGFKGTNVLIAVIMALVIVLVHEEQDPAGRWRKLAAYLGAVAAAAGVVLSAIMVAGVDVFSRLGSAWPSLSGLVDLASPFGVASFMFAGSHALSVNTYLLPAWLIAGALLMNGSLPRGNARAIYLGSGIWAIGWLVLAAANEYFPERYVFHALVPLALNIGSGWSLLRDTAVSRHGEAFAGGGARRFVVVAWMALPLAALAGPGVAGALVAAGVPVTRLSHTLLILAGLETLLVAAGLRVRPDRLATASAVFSAVGLTLWMLARESGLAPEFWPGGSGRVYVVVFGLSVVGSLAALTLAEGRRMVRVPDAAVVLAVGAIGFGLLRALPPILSPSYSLAEAGEELEVILAGREIVWTDRAASVFLDTEVRYREGYEFESPEVVVDMFNSVTDRFGETLYLDREFRIELGYEHMSRHDVEPFVRLYRRRPDAPS